jgi:hypothetical protein
MCRYLIGQAKGQHRSANCVDSVTFVPDRFQTCNFSVTGRISVGGELEKGFRLPLFALVFPLSARRILGASGE